MTVFSEPTSITNSHSDWKIPENSTKSTLTQQICCYTSTAIIRYFFLPYTCLILAIKNSHHIIFQVKLKNYIKDPSYFEQKKGRQFQSEYFGSVAALTFERYGHI